jgi:hypothetical protein
MSNLKEVTEQFEACKKWYRSAQVLDR